MDNAPFDNSWLIDGSMVLELKNNPPGTWIYLRAKLLNPVAKEEVVRHGREPCDRVIDLQPAIQCDVPRHSKPGAWRCEKRIKNFENKGLGKLLYWPLAVNQAWANLAMFSANLVVWLAVEVLSVETSVSALKPTRYRFFPLAGKIITVASIVGS